MAGEEVLQGLGRLAALRVPLLPVAGGRVAEARRQAQVWWFTRG